MKAVLVPTALVFAVAGFVLSPNSASAKGCIKGAIVGGVAGHYAGHHGLLGAAGSCIVGHHLAKKHAEEERARERAYEQQRRANPSPGSPSYGSGTPPAAYHISRPSIHPYNILMI
jgi:hypothetical protein